MGQPSWRFAGNERNSGKLFFRFVGYAALSVALMILDSRLAAVQYIRQAASVVLYPMQWFSNQPVRLYQYIGTLTQSQSGLIEQNRLLLEENGRLKTRLQRDEVNLSELNELRKLYRLQQAGINDVTGAEVISSGKDPLSDKLIINKGSLDGLKAGGERNLLYGGGNKLDLRYFPSVSDLKAKDILLTSGLDSVYPAGIPVATVDTIERSSGSPYYTASLSPFAALRGSRFVLVVSQPKSQTTKPQQ